MPRMCLKGTRLLDNKPQFPTFLLTEYSWTLPWFNNKRTPQTLVPGDTALGILPVFSLFAASNKSCFILPFLWCAYWLHTHKGWTYCIQLQCHRLPSTSEASGNTGCHLCFWFTSYRSEVPTTSSLGSINSLEWLIKLWETFYLLDYWFTITQEQPDGRDA